MPHTFAPATSTAPRVIPEVNRIPVKAVIRIPENDVRREIGQAIDGARCECQWTLDELAGHLPAPDGSDRRDERQVQRWIDGKERAQFDVLFACTEPQFVKALYEHLAPLSRTYERVVSVRRTA